MPAGAHSVDDHSREDQLNLQIREAESALEQGDTRAAEAKLKAIVTASAANAKDPRLLYDLGFAQERNGEDDDAAKSYAASSAAEPRFAEPKVALGLLDARAGRTESAHQQLQEAAAMETATPELRARALRALASLDETANPEAARQELLAALKLTRERPSDTLTAAELAEKAGDAIGAEAAFRKVLAQTPDDLDATVGLAHVLQQQGKLAEAETTLLAAKEAHPNDPNDPRVIAQLASVQAAQGRPEAAIPLLEQLQKTQAGSDSAVSQGSAVSRDSAVSQGSAVSQVSAVSQMLARLYVIVGRDADALQLYQGLAAARPSDPVLLDALGGEQVKVRNYAEAEKTLQKAVSLRDAFHDDTAWAEAEGHLAFAASKNHDPKGVLQALSARATVQPNSAASLFLEATAHDTLHETKEAERAYKAFLAMAGGKFPDEEFEARHRLVALQHSQQH